MDEEDCMVKCFNKDTIISNIVINNGCNITNKCNCNIYNVVIQLINNCYFALYSPESTYFMSKKVFNRIKIVIVEKGKTNNWLAEQLGVSIGSVSKWCTNTVQPGVETLFEIAAALDVDVRELLVSTKKHS
jgi:DNA-binding XRE family transcriptional regulator